MRYCVCMSILLLLSASGVSAADGRFEISQHCVSLGCFPGDSSGVPITITQPGSYVLTSNLTTGDVNQTLIEISAHDVSIDLNGFSLVGPISCSSPPACSSGSGTGNGIDMTGRKNFQLRNGGIRGMGQHGISLGNSTGYLIHDVQFLENRRNGIDGVNSREGLIRSVSVSRNGNLGISAGFSYVVSSTSMNNGSHANWNGFCSQNIFHRSGTNTVGDIRYCIGSSGDNICRGDSVTTAC